MAGEGVQNVIARRVTDDLIVFSGETSPSKEYIDQLNAVVAEFKAMENQEEVHDSCWAANHARGASMVDLDMVSEGD
ncbi:hypothetical protein Tco_0044725 [Tanacetum coccineum]